MLNFGFRARMAIVMVTPLFKRKKVPKRPVAAGHDATIEDFVADVDEKMRAPQGSGHNRGEFRTVRILARSAASKGNKKQSGINSSC